MTAASDVKPDPMAVLGALLRGHPAAAGMLSNTLRAEAFGLATFGRTDALDLFATHPLVLSATPHVLVYSQALAVLDETPDGQTVGVFADLADGVIARVWVVAATAADAHCEDAVPVARDDFLSQLRVPCLGDAGDHHGVDAAAWPSVLSLGCEALAAVGAPSAASSSQAVVIRAFSAEVSADFRPDGASGADGMLAALYSLRLQESSAPRRAHRRLALATARLDVMGKLVHSRLAMSDPLPAPAPVFFSAQ